MRGVGHNEYKKDKSKIQEKSDVQSRKEKKKREKATAYQEISCRRGVWIAPSTSNRSRQQVGTGGSLGWSISSGVQAVNVLLLWILGLLLSLGNSKWVHSDTYVHM